MRIFCLMTAFLWLALSSTGQTLGDLLHSAGVPAAGLAKAEIEESINGTNAVSGQYVYVVYVLVKGDLISGYPHLLRYDTKTGAILRSNLQLGEKDECCGSPLGIEFVSGYLILSFHDNPSASTVVVLDKKLAFVELLYGFGVHEIAPNQIVLTENMIHFAPVQPERLQFVDLRTGAAAELYPPKDDLLRKRFAQEHRLHMPTEETCREMNDPCDPEMYDEDISVLGADGRESFALIAYRDALHAIHKEETPVRVASDSALYLYLRGRGGWLYCEEPISQDEARDLIADDANGYARVKARCTPNQPVVPDLTTSEFNPFPAPSRRLK
jgi:hypothetical protein